MIQPLSLRYGIAAGIATVCFFLSFYFIKKELIFNTSIYYSSLIITLVCMWLAGIRLQLQQNLNFSALLPQLFLVFILSEICYFTWYYVMVNHIDTSLLDFQKTQMLQSFHDLKANTKDMKEIQGWNDAIQSLEKNGLTSISISSVLLQMGRGIIGGFVLSYLLAFVLNRKN
jgi:Protein of unknown function (DUF4199)